MTASMRSNGFPAFALAGLLAMTFAGAPPPLLAQMTGVVEGQVTEFESGRVLEGVTVVVDGTDFRAKTNSSGWYRIAGVPAGKANLRIELDDYASTVYSIVVDAGGVTVANLRIAGVAATLDQLLVSSSPRELPNRERGATIREVRPRTVGSGGRYSLGEMLRGRVPGLSVMRFNGQVGSGFRLLLRGINSISLSNAPLVYLDGIMVGGPSLSQRRMGGSVLNMLDPFSIDHIEVLSGPAASVRYGAGAANGVIMIHTKRGRQG